MLQKATPLHSKQPTGASNLQQTVTCELHWFSYNLITFCQLICVIFSVFPYSFLFISCHISQLSLLVAGWTIDWYVIL